ncbi:undecaprenyl-phosphate glucose phosphotransferase [Paraburkholderia lacunae]|uniref:Undecaprenyl-phosphate glucose phosphotransferase n=1 Tax=Paraburkholderia lacunae TaxID=2211104 RepID=A0A370MWX4_9BURK|nr:undecaprenyl-phosphate glucose phosphotransferase [Paraburkholderia lacunae]RDJ97816.1 undecaprenyl-phosphate glucose phosphotransferase [Paraburkholderia lacunae]
MSSVEFAPATPASFGMNELVVRMLDVVSIVVCARLASLLRFEELAPQGIDTALVTFAAAFALVVFPVFGIYQSWRGRSTLRLAAQVVLAWSVVQICVLVLLFGLHRTDSISRLWFACWTAFTAVSLVGTRMAVRSVLSHARNAGLNLRHVAIVGCGVHCEDIARNIRRSPGSGFRALAAFDARPTCNVSRARVPTFDDFNSFVGFVRRNMVREIWLALPLSEEQTILRFVNEFRDDFVNVRFIPDVRSLALFDSGVTDLIGMPAISLVGSPLPTHALLKKEIFDRIFAALALIALMPVLAVVAIAVKLSSPGPVFFKQKRKGADGRVFDIYKFRTMKLHTEQVGQLKQATRNDPRITRIGALLRRTSLDELPQFYNVLRGDMSVVGPRPHALEHDELYRNIVNGYLQRYRIKPGITGWAQVNGHRGETDRVEKMERRVEHDLYYLRHWSFALDMRIVAATVVHGLVNRNAY